MTTSIDLAPIATGPGLATLTLLVKATLVLLAALGATWALRRAAAGTRHLVWLVAVTALLCLPALSAWGPMRLEVLPAASPSIASAAPGNRAERAPGVASRTDRESSIAASIPSSTFAADERASDVSPRGGLTSIGIAGLAARAWALVSVLLLAWLAAGALAVRRIVRRAEPLESSEWTAPLWEIADRLGIDDAPRLVRSADVAMPFACGLRRPTIVLPAECDGWSADRRSAVLLHELGHVRRRDLVWHTLARLACAAYWFHPLAWTAARRLRAESERACDDLALTCGARASDYAEHLLDIVTGVRGDSTPAVALAMARRKEFEGRMLAILDPELERAAPSRRWSATLVGALVALCAMIGATTPAARGAEAAPIAVVPRGMRPGGPRDSVRRVEAARDLAASREAARPRAQAWGHARAEAHDPSPSPAPIAHSAPVPDPEPTLHIDVDVRAIASAAAGGRGARSDDERARLLAGILRSDTSAKLRRVAAWGLEKYAGSDVAAQALAAALARDASAEVREMSAWALAGADEGGAVREALVAALRNDRDAKVRSTAAWALGEVGDDDESAVAALTAALGAESSEMRAVAAWALGQVGPKRAPKPLVALLDDSEPRVRRVAAWALHQIEDAEAAGALEAAMAKESDRDVQRAEVRALAALGEKSVDAIKRLIDSKDPEVRSLAIRSLAGQGGGSWPWPWPQPRPYP